MADPFDAAVVSLVCDHACMEARATNTAQANLSVDIAFIEFSIRYGSRDQKLWRMPIIAAVVDTPGATGWPYTIVWFMVPLLLTYPTCA
jgi:hypothetical protein